VKHGHLSGLKLQSELGEMFWSFNLCAEKLQIWVTEAAGKICVVLIKLFWLKKS